MDRAGTTDNSMRISGGTAEPLGASWTGAGVNFAVYSAHAERVELCLYDPGGRHELARMPLPGRTGDVWHGFVAAPSVGPGSLYGLRMHGPFDPARGHLFNPAKLLLDPCALDIVGQVEHHPALDAASAEDSAAYVPRSRVVADAFDWGVAGAPGTPWRDTVIYELHVKGYTQLHPAVPPEWRGKYLGLTVPAVLDYIRGLGVTAVELLPCQAFVSEHFLVERGLTNYWGYNPIAWFAPDRRYAVADPVAEFKQMVRALHEAGLEVILDVVLNHTAEGGAGGPVLCLKGIDNSAYYRLDPHDMTHYDNVTGTGNTLRAEHPAVQRLMLDCLRYWASEMRVDGFRFDLAPVLGRGPAGFTPQAPLFLALRSDPVLTYTKLIAEPWDLGPGGYVPGRFPAGWSEWNDRFRDTTRAFWRGDAPMVPSLAERLAGSSDLFRQAGRKPSASINFVTAHDGFTLRDLVSYDERHNEANGEANRDGHHDNLSWNCGVEGVTTDPGVRALRQRQMRNMLATLCLAQGVPMLLAGDEFGRTQGGNNNAYCQDNETSWLDWRLDDSQQAQIRFVADLLALRAARPELRRETFLKGASLLESDRDVRWLHPQGREMGHADWLDTSLRCFGVQLRALADDDAPESARPPGLLILLCAASSDTGFTMPESALGGWQSLLDTRQDGVQGLIRGGESLLLPARSLVVFHEHPADYTASVQDV